jgi:hypothetical protein
MAAPAYTTNLALLTDWETPPTFDNFTNFTNSNTNVGDDAATDFPIQSATHFSAATRNAGANGFAADNGANITWTSGWNFFLWGTFLPANAVDTDANNGIVMMVGATTADHYVWTVGGRDFGRYPYGGWQNFVADPEVTTGRTTTGTPGTNYRWCGMGVNQTVAIAKGDPFGIDAIRYGRGDIVVTAGDLANGYATFIGMATQNDNSANRWGLFQDQNGSYLWKGLMSLGTAATAVDFRDANTVITLDNTRRVQPSFNRIEVTNAASNVEWDTILITSLGTTSRGQFECVDDATVTLNGCTFTDMDTFIFQPNSTIVTTTFRRCNQITAGGASFTDCSFLNATSQITVDATSTSLFDNCTFQSDGTNHAVDLGTVATTQTMSWDNFLIGYAAVDGSTGTEAIAVNIASPNVLTINVGQGYDSPSVSQSGDGTVIVQAVVNFSLTGLVNNTEVGIYDSTTYAELFHQEDSTGGTVLYQYNYVADQTVDIVVHNIEYEHIRIFNYNLGGTDASIPIQQRRDRNYLNPP